MRDRDATLRETRPTEREALEHANRMCLCESYYNCHCGKCRERVKAGEPIYTAIARLERLGWVEWKNGDPRLTQAGRVRLEELADV